MQVECTVSFWEVGSSRKASRREVYSLIDINPNLQSFLWKSTQREREREEGGQEGGEFSKNSRDKLNWLLHWCHYMYMYVQIITKTFFKSIQYVSLVVENISCTKLFLYWWAGFIFVLKIKHIQKDHNCEKLDHVIIGKKTVCHWTQNKPTVVSSSWWWGVW